MDKETALYILYALAIYTVIVFLFIWWENRRTRFNLVVKEHEMQRRMYEMAVLNELGERIGYSLNVQKIMDVIISSLRRLLPYSTVSYLLLGEEGKMIFHCVLEESVNRHFVEEVKQRMITAFEVINGNKINLQKLDESVSGNITNEGNHSEIKSFFNVPVVINDKPTGLLNVASSHAGLYKEEEMTVLYTIINQASGAVSRLENILNQEKGKLNSMVKSMADGVFMVDVRNRLLVINPAARLMLGIAKQMPTIFDVLEAFASKLDLRTKIEESVASDKLLVEEELKLDKKFLRLLISPVKDQDNKALGAVVLLHDITKETEIEKMREDFTSMMVHELRNPLTGIRSIAGLLKQDKFKNEQQKYQEFVDLIVSNSTSMLDLVNDLLDVAKMEAGKFQIFPKATNIAELIKARISSFEPLLAEHVKLETKLESDLPLLDVDEQKIGQVLNNLLSNAVKYTKSGKIVVSVFVLRANQKLEERVKTLGLEWMGIRPGVKFDSDQLIIAVTDSGTGIQQDQFSKLFNKFSQLEQSAALEKKGTGLGLVISKGIVDAHNGNINVFSEVGHGSTFYFSLPMVLGTTKVE